MNDQPLPELSLPTEEKSLAQTSTNSNGNVTHSTRQIDKNPNVIEVNGRKYYLTPKYEEFVRLYTDPKSETFGNKTRSALIAYKLDEKTQQGVAYQIARANIGKHRDIAERYYETKGFNYLRYLDLLLKRALETDKVDWSDRVAENAGWKIAESEAPTTVNNTQINVMNAGDKPAEEWNEQFAKFLENGITK